MRRPSSLLHLSRHTWFVLVAAAFGARDMCAGGGRRPDPEPPADAAPSDAAKDGTMSRRDVPAKELLAAHATTSRGVRN